MGLASVIRSAVATANKVTSDLQVSVSHRAWTRQDEYGAPQYATAVARPALVEYQRKKLPGADGQEVLSRATITFLFPVPAHGATGRQEPIDPRDSLTLPDGSTGPILDIQGFMDPGTSKAYLYQVWIG